MINVIMCKEEETTWKGAECLAIFAQSDGNGTRPREETDRLKLVAW